MFTENAFYERVTNGNLQTTLPMQCEREPKTSLELATLAAGSATASYTA